MADSPSRPDPSGTSGGRVGAPGFRILLLATVCAFANYAPLLSVVPLWAADGGSAAGGVGAATGVTMATTVAAQLCMGGLLRRWTLRQLLAGGALLLGLPTFAYPLSSALDSVLAISAVRGAGFGIVAVAGSALVAELVQAEHHGRAVGWYGVAVGLGQVALLPLGVWVAQHLGFAGVFYATGLLAVVACPLALALPRPPTPPSDGEDAPARKARRAPQEAHQRPERGGGRPQLRRYAAYVGPFAVLLTAACALGGVTSFVPLALSSPSASYALFAVSAGTVVGRYLAGVRSDRRGAGRHLGWYVGVCAGGMAGIAALTQATSHGGVLALLPAACYGLGFGALQNDTLVLMFRRAQPGAHATASTAWNMAFDGGTGIGAVGVGALAHALGVPGSFWITAALVACAVPLGIGRRRPRRHAPRAGGGRRQGRRTREAAESERAPRRRS